MTPDGSEHFKLGTMVRIRDSGFVPGPIVELRGPLGPGGAHVYRVQVRRKPAAYIEVLENQLEEVADSGKSIPSKSSA